MINIHHQFNQDRQDLLQELKMINDYTEPISNAFIIIFDLENIYLDTNFIPIGCKMTIL